MTVQEGILIALVSAGLVWIFHGIWILKDWHLEHFFAGLDDAVRKRILTCTTLQIGLPLVFLASLGIRLSMKDTSDISKSLVLSTIGQLLLDIIASIYLIGVLCILLSFLKAVLLVVGLIIEDAYNASKLKSLFLKFVLFSSSLICVGIVFS